MELLLYIIKKIFLKIKIFLLVSFWETAMVPLVQIKAWKGEHWLLNIQLKNVCNMDHQSKEAPQRSSAASQANVKFLVLLQNAS
jgi:hypothetical protein